MAFKRALWESGLTYQQVCKTCRNVMTYTDDILDFRPWFPDGFVYCTKCKTPLRHNENYAINAPKMQNTFAPSPAVGQRNFAPEQSGIALFCTQCGKAFNEGDRFCSECGAKRQ